MSSDESVSSAKGPEPRGRILDSVMGLIAASLVLITDMTLISQRMIKLFTRRNSYVETLIQTKPSMAANVMNDIMCCHPENKLLPSPFPHNPIPTQLCSLLVSHALALHPCFCLNMRSVLSTSFAKVYNSDTNNHQRYMNSTLT